MGFRRVGQICSSRVDFPSEAISKALKTNSTLTSINLAWNRIGEVGVKARWVSGRCCSRVAFPREAICEALKRNSTLTSINLESNRIGVEGAKARLHRPARGGWEGPVSFKEVSGARLLSRVRRSPKRSRATPHSQAFSLLTTASAMRVGRSAWLHRDECCCSGVSFPSEAICEALKTNSTLTSMNVEGNDISEQVVMPPSRSNLSLFFSLPGACGDAEKVPTRGFLGGRGSRVHAFA